MSNFHGIILPEIHFHLATQLCRTTCRAYFSFYFFLKLYVRNCKKSIMSPSLNEVIVLSSLGTQQLKYSLLLKFIFNWTGCGNGWSPDTDIS